MKDKYDSFLRISLEDIEASRILLKNNFCPQAIFYFQQSVEKATKYIGLSSKIIEEKDLQSDISHKFLKIFKKAVKVFNEKYTPNSKSDFEKEFQFIQDFIRQNSLDITIPQIIEQIENYKSEIPDTFFDYTKIATPEDLVCTLNKIDPNNTDIEVIKMHSNDKLFRRIIEERSKKFLIVFPGYIQSILILFVLGCVINDHFSYVRYPDSKMKNPSSIYNKENLLIISLPFFLDTTEDCIKKILEFNNAN
jgi:hypothetical protein